MPFGKKGVVSINLFIEKKKAPIPITNRESAKIA
jgi:hypothetical protein